MKLFSKKSNAAFAGSKRADSVPDAPQSASETQPSESAPQKPARRRRVQRTVALILSIVCFLELLYCIAVFSNIPFIKKWRDIYISTAMNTGSHQWLATAFIPQSVVQEVVDREEAARQAQQGLISTWEPTETTEDSTTESEPAPTEDPAAQAERDFYALFWELDRDTWDAYLASHPDTLAGGWENICINASGLDEDGTEIYTSMGEQVLALDAKNRILIVRVSGSGYRGALAIAKDPARLSCHPSKTLGSYGQYAGTIAVAHNGVLAMTASGFEDAGGVGNGGTLAGYAMCNGVGYGTHMRSGYRRLELREDNRFYIVDATGAVTEGTRDAVEFSPALIVDGVLRSDEIRLWSGLQPRACIGQSERGEVLMLVIEGRLSGSLGVTLEECGEILLRHNCMQAMNLDGGTSAILWYDGAYITRCSNTDLPCGRPLPTAWVYARADESTQ